MILYTTHNEVVAALLQDAPADTTHVVYNDIVTVDGSIYETATIRYWHYVEERNSVSKTAHQVRDTSGNPVGYVII